MLGVIWKMLETSTIGSNGRETAPRSTGTGTPFDVCAPNTGGTSRKETCRYGVPMHGLKDLFRCYPMGAPS